MHAVIKLADICSFFKDPRFLYTCGLCVNRRWSKKQHWSHFTHIFYTCINIQDGNSGRWHALTGDTETKELPMKCCFWPYQLPRGKRDGKCNPMIVFGIGNNTCSNLRKKYAVSAKCYWVAKAETGIFVRGSQTAVMGTNDGGGSELLAVIKTSIRFQSWSRRAGG